MTSNPESRVTVRRRGATIVAGIMLLVFLGCGVGLFQRYFADADAPQLEDDAEHFKYGSIGAEVDGYPFRLWRALPVVFSDTLPNGYASFGFYTEAGSALPVGITVRKYGIQRVGFNCATCHTTTVNGEELILGAPAIRLDLQRYVEFLLASSTDERFQADTVFAALDSLGEPLPLIDRWVYRLFIIPTVRRRAQAAIDSNAWMKSRPPFGPGRTDAGNPWRLRFGMDPANDTVIATVDFPSVWNQGIREHAWLHWDGNNNSLDERNLSAALAGGATESSLDLGAITRVATWLMDVPAPSYPFPIDSAKADMGAVLYRELGCGVCHDVTGQAYGGTTPIAEVGTDPERFNAFDSTLLRHLQTVGDGYAWQFRHYAKSNGYANSALDGIWARAPYLHNGSVPTLSDLLQVPEQRMTIFARGCDRFDPEHVGFTCAEGFDYDTGQPGNSNRGHPYGTELSDADRLALIEYLKTL